MDYLKNHCWCHSSHWDGKDFNCKIIVGLNSYEEHNKEDFENITTKLKGFCQETYDILGAKWLERGIPEAEVKEMCSKSYSTLKPEVLDWLYENVPDKNGEKMWCIGDEAYLMNDGCGINIFFQQTKHAMAFIKRWSKWKKPVRYTQYFTDVRKTLNLETLKYESKT